MIRDSQSNLRIEVKLCDFRKLCEFMCVGQRRETLTTKNCTPYKRTSVDRI
jgi:hypothetical protein